MHAKSLITLGHRLTQLKWVFGFIIIMLSTKNKLQKSNLMWIKQANLKFLDFLKRLLKYFGNDRQATVLTERVNNELSHLEEIFDRGMIPLDTPELKKVAQFILEKIKENDEDQYEALLESIGVEITL